jgi:hypothetical protein
MNYTGSFYIPYDNSYCINCRSGKSARLVPRSPNDLDYIGPNKEEENANFKIVCEPYEETVYEPVFNEKFTYIFINVVSSKTKNLYRTLFNKRGVI